MVIITIQLCAQERTVTGMIVSDLDKLPLQGVTVLNTKTNKSTSTAINGSFSMKASNGETLLFTFIGFTPQRIIVGNNTLLNLSLRSSTTQLEEVTVAMDIKRNPNELGYSVQKVTGKEIQETQRENFVNSLQGRVAGLTVTPTSGVAGASSSIVLRGFNTMSGNNQPLFIVDGIILDNQTLNENSYGGSGIGLASDLPNRNNDYTNRIADINPNDIESVTVLKGPEATALYGSQASSGAIVITTRKAKSTAGKVLINYDDNFRMRKITRFADVNNDYGPGTNGVPTPPPLSGQFTSFGPAWPTDTKRFDNLHHFFRTGFSQTHNLGLEFGTLNSGYRLSGQYFDDHGVVPNNTYTKYNFKLSNNTKIGKYIKITPSLAYIKSDNKKPLKGASGYLLDLYAWPANNDITNYEDPRGNKLLLFNSNYNVDFDNPLWSAYHNTSGDKTNRYVATLGIDFNPFAWLSIAGRFGYDTYKTDGYLFTHPQSFLVSVATGGSLDNYYRTYKGYNHTITATAKKEVGKFTARLLVGTMWQDLETQQFGVAGTHLIDSTGTDSSNTLPATRTRLLRNYFGLPNLSIIRELAYFTDATIGYNNVVFLSYTHRFETASVLPKKNRNYNYPGASLSVIISDIFPFLKSGNFLDFAKLRGSLASTARLNDPYSNQSVFVNNQSSSVVPGFTYGFTNANPDLHPERQRTYEVGAEFRFLKNALTIEAAYYNTLCLDQISQGYRASYATGFILNTGNVSSLRNQGVELTVTANPVKNKNFNWKINFNFNHMWSKVLTLPLAIGIKNDYYNSDTYLSGNVRGGLVRGNSTGTITGYGYQRNAAGQILINPASGLALLENINYVRGDRTPKFTLGTLNSFRYKNFTFNFLWDLKVGGDIYNGTDYFLTGIGKSARTADRKIPVVVDGVLNDGLQNTANPTKNTIVVSPYYLNTYYGSTSLPDEEFVQKNVNWLRLRDLTLAYTLPQKTSLKIKGMKSLSIFITGNDLVLITNYAGADPAVNANNPGTSGVGAYGMDYGSPPTPLSLSFGLHAGF